MVDCSLSEMRDHVIKSKIYWQFTVFIICKCNKEMENSELNYNIVLVIIDVLLTK